MADHQRVSGQCCRLLQERDALAGLSEGDDGVDGGRLDLVELRPEVTIVRLPCVSDQRRDPIPLLQHLDEQVGPRVVDANTAAEHRNLLEVEGLCDVVGEQVSQELIARRDAENPLSALGRARAGASDDVRDPGLLDRFAACHDEGAKQLPHDGHHLRLGDQRTGGCDGALC